MKQNLVTLVVLCHLWYILAFQRSISKNVLSKSCVSSRIEISSTRLFVTSSALVIRKNKVKEIELLKKNVTETNNHVINRYVYHGEQLYGVSKPISILEGIVNKYNTVSVLAEYNRKSKTGFILGLPPPEITGGILRDAGAKAIIVSMDKRVGGVTIEEFYRLCREQYAARTFTPGPISVVWNDYIVDDIQIIYAAALGAASVILDPEVLLDYNDLVEKIMTCRKYKLEPIVLIKTAEEGRDAFQAGTKIVCMRNLNDQGYLELRKQLPTSPNHIYVAKLRAEVDFSIYSEIDTAWLLRDNGFHSIWPSPEAIYATGVSDIYSNIHALKSKASREYLSPRQFLMDRNKEGAREFLGNIYF